MCFARVVRDLLELSNLEMIHWRPRLFFSCCQSNKRIGVHATLGINNMTSYGPFKTRQVNSKHITIALCHNTKIRNLFHVKRLFFQQYTIVTALYNSKQRPPTNYRNLIKSQLLPCLTSSHSVQQFQSYAPKVTNTHA